MRSWLVQLGDSWQKLWKNPSQRKINQSQFSNLCRWCRDFSIYLNIICHDISHAGALMEGWFQHCNFWPSGWSMGLSSTLSISSSLASCRSQKWQVDKMLTTGGSSYSPKTHLFLEKALNWSMKLVGMTFDTFWRFGWRVLVLWMGCMNTVLTVLRDVLKDKVKEGAFIFRWLLLYSFTDVWTLETSLISNPLHYRLNPHWASQCYRGYNSGPMTIAHKPSPTPQSTKKKITCSPNKTKLRKFKQKNSLYT